MKLQFWSFDVIFAIVIFVIAVSILAFVWHTLSSEVAVTNAYGIEDLQQQLQSLQVRVFSPGSPSDWPAQIVPTNTETWGNVTIGLSNSTGAQTVLSAQKVATLEGMANENYQSTKQELGVGFDYYITIKTDSLNIAIGRNPASYNATSEQVDTRAVILNGRSAQMQIIVWTNTSFGVG